MLLFRVMVVLALVAPLSGRRAQTVLAKGGGKGRMVKLMLKPSVKVSTSFSSSSVHSTSLSPWNHTEQCEDNRQPRCLFHAHCLTHGCVDPQWGSEDLSVEAKPIYYQFMVLYRVPQVRLKPRKKKSRRGYDFRLDTVKVSVGCTCVRPSVLPQK